MRKLVKKTLAAALILGVLLMPAALPEGETIQENEIVVSAAVEDAVEEQTADLAGEESVEAEPFELTPEFTGAPLHIALPNVSLDGDWDNDALFEGWIRSALPAPKGTAVSNEAPQVGRTWLTGTGLKMYDALARQITEVANGERTSTVFELDDDELGLTESWHTLEELGVKSPDDKGFWEAIAAVEDIDLRLLIDALLADYPYEMFWFDKISGYAPEYDVVTPSGDQAEPVVRLSHMKIYMLVSVDYAADDCRVNALPARVAAAVRNIQSIVSDCADKGDADKVYAYADEICRLAAYNRDAMQSLPYGDPWQLVCVFDGDPETKVVCEGYAKAMKYLMDLSDFQGNVECVLMSGDMVEGEGPGGFHMWDIILMPDGKRYLADVTNSDGGDYLSGWLFLRGVSGSVSEGYRCDIPDVESILYWISDDDLIDFGADSPWLQWSQTDYDPDAPAPAPAEIHIAPESPAPLAVKKTLTLKVYDANHRLIPARKVTWASKNPEIATVNKGRVRGVAPGDAEITASYGDDTVSVSLMVYDGTAPAAIDFKADSVSLAVKKTLDLGSSKYLALAPARAKAKSLTWVSGDTKVVTVKNGRVKAVAPGTTVVMARYPGVVSAAITVKVFDPKAPTAIAFKADAAAVRVKKTLSLTGRKWLEVLPSTARAKDLVWQSSNESIATVKAGRVKGVSAGTVTITAASKDGALTDSITVTVE